MPVKAVWNRAPLRPNKLSQLPLTAIRPSGWLLRELKAQAALFLELPPSALINTPLPPRVLEPIFILAYVSADETFIKLAEQMMDTAASAAELALKGIEAQFAARVKDDGDSGSVQNEDEPSDAGDHAIEGLTDQDYPPSPYEEGLNAGRDLFRSGSRSPAPPPARKPVPDWLLAILSPDGYATPQALTRCYTATGDVRMLKLALRLLTIQAQALSLVPTADIPAKTRANAGEFIAALLDVYNRTGQPQLLTIAKRWSDIGMDWTAWYARFPQTQPMYRSLPFSQLLAQIKAERETGDTFGYFTSLSMTARGDYAARGLAATAIQAALSGSGKEEQAFAVGLEKLMKYHGTALGMFTADMYLSGRNPSQAVHVPAITEMIHALITQARMVSQFSAVAFAAESLEKLIFSANMASFTPDWRFRQGAQRVNQIESARAPTTSYNLMEDVYLFAKTKPCEEDTALALSSLSGFTQTAWMAAAGGGLAALSYIPCEVRDRVDGTLIKITVDSNYPYSGEVRMSFAMREPVKLTLFLRIPRWASGATLSISSGEKPDCVPGTFLRIERIFNPGDTIDINLPMRPRMEEMNGFWIERGPVLYSLPIDADVADASTLDGTEALGLNPMSDWKYALLSDTPLSEEPPPHPGEPPRVRAAVVPLANWNDKRRAPEPPPREPKASGPAKIVSFVPYAMAPLRIAQFPAARSASHASERMDDAANTLTAQPSPPTTPGKGAPILHME